MLSQADLSKFFIIAGPCVIENELITMSIAEHLKKLANELRIPLIFKASYRKANRTKLNSFSGIGDTKALAILKKVKNELNLAILTDVHESVEIKPLKTIVDVIQIPAFLCRQTELILAAAQSGAWVNIKKGQFMSAEAMRFALEKATSTGNEKLMVTERGTQFGYRDLVVDDRGSPIMKAFCDHVVFDCTHTVQQPNQLSGVTGGNPQMIKTLASAAIAAGANGLFIETHSNPVNAKSDGANMLELSNMDDFLKEMIDLYNFVNRTT